MSVASAGLLFGDTAADIYWKLDDIRYLDEQSITGMDSLVTASFPRNTEITVIDKNQQELPFIIKYQCVSSSFFPYKVIRPVSGKGKLDAPDEVIISQEFAHKAFGKEDPTGMIIHLVPTYKEYPEQIKDYKIVGVVTDQDIDCYFPYPWIRMHHSVSVLSSWEKPLWKT